MSLSSLHSVPVRYMRIFVFFDLPVDTSRDRRNYRVFRRELIKQGFVMLQESVYVKITLTNAVTVAAIENVRKICPDRGTIHILKVTEKQFSDIVDINNSGALESSVMSSDSVVIL